MYELLFSPQAERFLRKLKEKPLKEAYKTALLELKKNPYIGRPKRGDLAGIYGFDVKYRGTNHEIACTISGIKPLKKGYSIHPFDNPR